MCSCVKAGFRPINNKHAIDEVVFNLHFVVPLNSQELENFVQNANTIMADYPYFTTEVGLLTSIPSITGIVQPITAPREMLTGVYFFEKVPFDESNIIVFIGDHLQINFKIYDGWESNSAKAFNIMQSLLEFQKPHLTQVSLAYKDRFIAEKWSLIKNKKDTISCLFNVNSKLISTNIFDCYQPWHSFHGYFEDNDFESFKILNNIKTGMIFKSGSEDTSEIYISTELTGIYLDNCGLTFDLGIIKALFNYLHDNCKNTVRNILTKSVSDAIGLNTD